MNTQFAWTGMHEMGWHPADDKPSPEKKTPRVLRYVALDGRIQKYVMKQENE